MRVKDFCVESVRRFAGKAGLLACVALLSFGFKDGDRILFLGDSITHSGGYPRTICDYCVTRYPDCSIDIEVVGVPGDGVRWCGGRIEEEVVSRKPDVLSVMFGMNDVEHFLPSWKKGADVEKQCKQADRLVSAFKAGHAELVKKVRSALPGVRLVCLTPTPYDEFSEGGRYTTNNHAGVNIALAGVAEHVRRSAERFGYKVVDLNSAMLSQLRNNGGRCEMWGADRVHPNGLGHLYIAWQFLVQTGASPTVSDMAFDCTGRRVMRQDNVEVRDFAVSGDGRVSFSALEKALPFPVDHALAAFARDSGMVDDISRETVSFSGLDGGRWNLLIDGEVVLSASAEKLAAGVNLSLCDTPQMRQAQQVRLANKRRFDELDYLLGRFRLARWALRRWSKVNPDDLAEVKRFKEEMPEKERGRWAWVALKPYLDNWGRRGEIRAEIAERSKAIRAMAKPAWHRYELVPARDFHVDAKCGDDGNDGLSAGHAWRTIERASRQKLSAGDRLLFRAGCVWRLDRTFRIKASGSIGAPVVLTRYGHGAAPELRASLDGASLDWNLETNSLWSTSCGKTDIGNIVWDEGCGFKKPCLGDVVSDGDFWHDRESGKLFFRCRDNPKSAYHGLELARKTNVVRIDNASNIEIEGISIGYTGSHGIRGCNVRHVKIRGCAFRWIGGSFLVEPNEKKPHGVRYGNGIEIWTGGDSSDIHVEGCEFNDIYDVAITTQGPLEGSLDGMVIESNRISRCEQGYEFWFSNPKFKAGTVEVVGNDFEDSGFGWSHAQRPNKIATHILSYNVNCPKGRIVLRGNRFGRTAECAIWLFGIGAKEWLEVGDNEVIDDLGGLFRWRENGAWQNRTLAL